MLDTLTAWFAQAPAHSAEMAGAWIASLLTLAVLSYILGNNPVFRVAEYVFIGIAAGYGAALVWNHVLGPRILMFIGDPKIYWHYGVFFTLGILLLARGSKSLSILGNIPMGVLFGTGAALALGGSLTGSLIPQLQASVVSLAPADYGGGSIGWAYALDALLLVLGTIATLSAFHFAGKGRGAWNAWGYGLLRILGGAGRGVIMVTFGVLLAGAMLTFFTLLNSRLIFLAQSWFKLLANMGL
jgi:hypothetical protein